MAILTGSSRIHILTTNGMKPTGTSLSVWSEESIACVKVAGRANFSASLTFKEVMQHLQDEGHDRVVVDLTDCPIMDSTFVGVLAGLRRRPHAMTNKNGHRDIEILNPNQRVTDLLDNLGITNFFKIHTGAVLEHHTAPDFEEDTQTSISRRHELSETCLEAHRTLMELNEKNVSKFKDVTRFLEEEIRRSSPSSS